jgi:hypothetical protein
VDFKTMQGKTLLKSQRAQRALWVDAWLYKWLVDNAIHYRFFPLSTEEWHWDYK